MRMGFACGALAAAVSLVSTAAAAAALTAADVPKTVVTSAAALQKLVANTGVTLQWNWETRAGELAVSARDGYLALTGVQHAANGGTLDLDGIVVRIDARSFLFKGRIAMHDADANVDCVRDGDLHVPHHGRRANSGA